MTFACFWPKKFKKFKKFKKIKIASLRPVLRPEPCRAQNMPTNRLTTRNLSRNDFCLFLAGPGRAHNIPTNRLSMPEPGRTENMPTNRLTVIRAGGPDGGSRFYFFDSFYCKRWKNEQVTFSLFKMARVSVD